MAGRKVDFDDWVVNAIGSILNASVTPLTDRQLRVFLILEGHARDKPYCWPQNETLARLAGKSASKVREILRELETADRPWIRRIPNEARRDRTGFVLLRRSHPGYPSWPADRPIEEAAATIDGQRRRGASGSPGLPGTGQGGEAEIGQGGAARNRATEIHQGPKFTNVESSRGSAAGARDDMPPGMRGLVDLARHHLGETAAAAVERHAGEIIGEFGQRPGPYAHALIAAAERNRNNPADPIRSPHGWCMAKARAIARQDAARHEPPARSAEVVTIDPMTLGTASSAEDIAAALRWFVGRGSLSPAATENAASAFCRVFHLDPRGTKYDTSVPGVKLRCRSGFEWVCRWLASGALTWETTCEAIEGAKRESQVGVGKFDPQRLGRGLLRRLVHPRTAPVNAE